MKRVRILLRVSSNQQLEADGDLSVQRQLVREYIQRHEDWQLDDKEYFEGSSSGYKNAVDKRDILQEALSDARKGEYDILAAYKDDRIGRRMWEIGAYVMTLKSCRVDIYTVKDGCISPEDDDIMGQMMLALRYGNAQKSSSDTGMRVKDTAEKLVRQGKFMGGAAPYGYRLVFSGELSKHGRALHRLEIVPEQAALVRKIYDLSFYQELGSMKIAKTLNAEEYDRKMAPGSEWKCSTITGILTNPVYAGRAAYKRRERTGGSCRRQALDSWIIAEKPEPGLQIIDETLWKPVQEKRKARAARYRPNRNDNKNGPKTPVISRNDGVLPLRDVLYCGCCGQKMTNGTRYSYWRLQDTGEKRSRKIPLYRCPSAHNGVPHNGNTQFHADLLEKAVFSCLTDYIGRLLQEDDITAACEEHQASQKKRLKEEQKRLQKELDKTARDIRIMQAHIPDAMTGAYPLSVAELAAAIRWHTEKKSLLEKEWHKKKEALKTFPAPKAFHTETAGPDDARTGPPRKNFPPLSWTQVFENASAETKRVLANRLLERVEISTEQLLIRFRDS
ncbi:MAG: recombinase family protein [Blautia sp.]|nr:recombinase family protein [Blautia sp.]MCM1202117.1 recombinase family protein [Bacteroides fragilis]